VLIGIVGKPSSGKSTFLNAACLTSAKVGNYPFTTVEPNPGVAYVRISCPCQELKVECNPQNALCVGGIRLVPINLLDVPGLVPDAHKGKGLGNKFMDSLFRASGLIHVVDASGSLDAEGREVEAGTWDPLEDIIFLERETVMWLHAIIQRYWRQISGRVKAEKISITDLLAEKLSGLGISLDHLKKAIIKSSLNDRNVGSWSSEDQLNYTRAVLKISKPTVIAANKIDRETTAANIINLKNKYNGEVIPCSALGEYALRKLAASEDISYRPGDGDFTIQENSKMSDSTREKILQLQETVLKKYGSTGVQGTIDHMVFDRLGLIGVFPVEDVAKYSNHKGDVLPDVYLVPVGTTAKELAFKIHTDLGNTFIHAIDARTKRRLSDSYNLKNGDIIRIVSASGRK
jgi:ribosome-binding ATPase YchF (GTP1/OBG family)